MSLLELVALNHLPQVQLVQVESSQGAALMQTDLYFGRNIGTTGRVTKQQFQQFLQDIVTSRFPEGLTVYSANGQYLDSAGDLIREPSQVVSLAYKNNAENQQAIDQIIAIYQQRFQQETVLQVENLDIAVGLGQGEDVIDNDSTPELIQVDLYFGRRIETGEQVSDRQFRQFLRDQLTPRFPDGLTVYNTNGQFLDDTNILIREPSQVVSLILEDTENNEQSLYSIINAYKTQFRQESVLEVVNEAVSVGFGQGEDVIDNDPTPEVIQIDLYFGRRIGTTGRVSDRQFRQFLRDQITLRFPDGLTVYDANGQFLDDSNRLIREPSKVVSLIVEDTYTNEQSINQIIDAYKQQFRQESVLAVVDETLNIAFDSEANSVSTGIVLMPLPLFDSIRQPGLAIPTAVSLVSPF